jgi:hypothetical protein
MPELKIVPTVTMAAVILVSACSQVPPDHGEPPATCTTTGEPQSAHEVALYRQLERCASKAEGVSVQSRDEGSIPRVAEEWDHACTANGAGRCLTTPAGEEASGYYSQQCNIIHVAVREPGLVAHESLHSILCDVKDLHCDPNHTSESFLKCTVFSECADHSLMLFSALCDGVRDCPGGEDESRCAK